LLCKLDEHRAVIGASAHDPDLIAKVAKNRAPLPGQERAARDASSRSFVSARIHSSNFFRSAYGNANTITAEVPDPPKNPDTTPEVVATYCLPPIS